MKSYPSITYPGKKGVGKQLHTFAKLDGSNLRFEWTKKKGWHKFGTRRHLFDESFDVYGPAIPLFRERLAEKLERVIHDNRWDKAIVFCEYYGPGSLGGQHEPGASMELTVIDVNPHRKGILSPTDFLKMFGEVGPHYLGYLKWSTELIEQVRHGELEGATFEGVVGKYMEGKVLKMHKTKTEAWREAILARYGEVRGRKLINS